MQLIELLFDIIIFLSFLAIVVDFRVFKQQTRFRIPYACVYSKIVISLFGCFKINVAHRHSYLQVAHTRQVISFTTIVLSRLGSSPSTLPAHPLCQPAISPLSSLPLYGSVAPITPAAAKCDPLRVMECANYNIC